MIIKSLLFIIICIFVYETYKTMLKMTEEYFTVGNTNFINNETNNDTEYNKLDTPYYKSFKPLEKEKEKEKEKETDKKDEYSPNYWNRNSLDTIYYKSFKPFEYNKDRAYYWRRDKLVEEGIRRNQDDLKEIKKVQTLFDNETNEEKKEQLKAELDLYKWKDNIFKTKDKKTGLSRDKRDIITDYYPEEIGQPRVWMERHSHIPDYSY